MDYREHFKTETGMQKFIFLPPVKLIPESLGNQLFLLKQSTSADSNSRQQGTFCLLS